MMQFLSSGARSFWVKAGLSLILFLAVAGLVLTDVQGVFRSGGASASWLARIGDHEIPATLIEQGFRRSVERQVTVMRQLNLPVDSAEVIRNQLDQGVLEVLLRREIAQVAVDAYAAEMGLAVSPEHAIALIQAEPLFQADGVFSRSLMLSRLPQLGFTEAGLVNYVRRNEQRRLLAAALRATVPYPEPLAALLWREKNEKRRAELVSFRLEDRTVDAEPTDEALTRHVEENRALYTTPEYRAVSWVVLDQEALGPIAVEEEAVTRWYEDNRAEFQTPERRRVTVIRARSAEAAGGVAAALAGGAEAAAAAAEAGARPPQQLDPMAADDTLSPEVAKAAFALAGPGAVAEPIETPLGWLVVRLDEILPPAEQTRDEAAAAIRARLTTTLAADRLNDRSEELVDALAGGADLEELAGSFGLTRRSVPAIDREGLSPDGGAVDLGPHQATVLAEAFALEPDQTGQAQPLPEGGVLAVAVDGVTAPALRPLEEVREVAVERWRTEQRRAAARALADQAETRLKEGEAAAAVAEALGGAHATTPPFRRDGSIEEAERGDGIAPLPPLVEPLFAAPATGGLARAETAGSIVVARLAAIDAPTLPEGPAREAALAGVRAELDQARGDELLVQFQAALQERYGVEINQRLFDQLTARLAPP